MDRARPRPTGLPREDRLRLRLLTLNVWGMPWMLARDLSARLAALDDALPRLDVDVAVFQEAWVPEAVDSLVATGRRCQLEYVWHYPAGLGGSGLLALSKLPIERATQSVELRSATSFRVLR